MKPIQKITKEEEDQLMEKEKTSKKLSKKENLSLLVRRGYSEAAVREMVYMYNKNYGKPIKMEL